MKLFKKKDLVYIDGMLVNEDTNEVVAVNQNIVIDLNSIETMYQQAKYLSEQGAYNPAPSLEGFERERFYTEKLPLAPEPETPVFDEKVKKSLALMDEMDAKAKTEKINESIEQFRDVFLFLEHDYVVNRGNDYQAFCFDLPQIGNPLELTQDKLVEILTFILENGTM